jgi:hypothetical protein
MFPNIAGFYFIPIIWVGKSLEVEAEDFDVSKLREEVLRADLGSGISIKVDRDGLFLFDFSNWNPAKSPKGKISADEITELILKRIMVLNTFLACLYTALNHHKEKTFFIEKMIVSPANIIKASSFNNGDLQLNSREAAELSGASCCSDYDPSKPIFADWRLNRILLIKDEELEEAISLFDSIVGDETTNLLQICELYIFSCKFFEDYNYNLSLLTSWAITENLLQQLWQRYIQVNRNREVKGEMAVFINKDRKEKLQGRDYSASTVSEILSLANEIPHDIYQDMSRIRQIRNDWIHGLKQVARTDTALAIDLAERILNFVGNVSLQAKINHRIYPGMGYIVAND